MIFIFIDLFEIGPFLVVAPLSTLEHWRRLLGCE